MTHKTRELLSIVELSQLSLSLLLAELAGLVGPGEVDHRDLEEGVAEYKVSKWFSCDSQV
jgi:hypothetical protein